MLFFPLIFLIFQPIFPYSLSDCSLLASTLSNASISLISLTSISCSYNIDSQTINVTNPLTISSGPLYATISLNNSQIQLQANCNLTNLRFEIHAQDSSLIYNNIFVISQNTITIFENCVFLLDISPSTSVTFYSVIYSLGGELIQISNLTVYQINTSSLQGSLRILDISSTNTVKVSGFQMEALLLSSISGMMNFDNVSSLLLNGIRLNNLFSNSLVSFIGIYDCNLYFSSSEFSGISLLNSGVIILISFSTSTNIPQLSLDCLGFTNISIEETSSMTSGLMSITSSSNYMTFSLSNLTITNNTIKGSLFIIIGNNLVTVLAMQNMTFLNNNYSINGVTLNNFFQVFINLLLSSTNNVGQVVGRSFMSITEACTLTLQNVSILFCESHSFAPALLITNSLATDQHYIQNCEFTGNIGTFTDSNSQAAVYFIYNTLAGNLTITQTIFQENVFDSSLTETEASSALVITGWSMNVTIELCLFLNNTSSDISSAIFFTVNTIYAVYNYFSGNTYSDDSNFYGILYTGAINLHFLENKFIENSGVDGTCIKVYEETTSELNVYLIEKNIVVNNYASYQAGFMSRDTFQAAEVTMSETYFLQNNADQYSGCFYFGTLYNTPQIDIFILYCLFEENYSALSGGVLYTAFSGEEISIFFNNSIFLENNLTDLTSIYPQGGMSDIWGFGSSTIYFNSCLSYNNKASNGGFLSMVVGNIVDFNSTYYVNYAAMLGGNYFLSSDVIGTFINSSFIGNYAKLGGAIFVHHDSEITLQNCFIRDVNAERGGVFMLDLSSQFTFSSLQIMNVSGDLGALIYLTNTNSLTSQFLNSDISESQSTISLIYCEQAELLLQGLNFSNIFSTIYHFHLSSVVVYQNIVKDISCIENGEGCIVNLFRTTSLLLQDIIIINMTRENTYDGGFIYSMESIFTVLNVSIKNLDSQTENSYGPIVLATSSVFAIKQLNIVDFGKGGFSIKDSSVLIYDSSFVNYNTSIRLFQDVISCDTCGMLVLNQTSFKGLNFDYSSLMSVIYINTFSGSMDVVDLVSLSQNIDLPFTGVDKDNYPFVISSSTFIENNSSQATVIYIEESPYVLIKNSSFINNYAGDFGGCIYLSFATLTAIAVNDSASGVLVINNTFVNNLAVNEGGVMKWLATVSPTMVNNQFLNNSAQYGPDVASIPVRLAFRVYQRDENDDTDAILSGKIPVYDSLLNRTSGFVIDNQMSGDIAFCTIVLQLVDNMDQPILESNSRAEADFEDGLKYLQVLSVQNMTTNFDCPLPTDPSNITRFNFTCNDWILSEVSNFSSRRDYSYINNLSTPVSLDLTLQKNNTDSRIYNKAERIVLTNTPSTFAFLIFSSNMVSSSFSALINSPLPNEFLNPTTGSYAIIIPIYFRTCNPGENYDNASNTCSLCVRTRYSFNPFNNGCKLCPPNADCEGGMNISLTQGYWRSGLLSDQIYQCEESLGSCEGGLESTCSSGYSGRLCDICNNANSNKNIFGFCDECIGKTGVFLVFIVFFLLTFGFLAFYSGNILLFNEGKSEEICVRKAAIRILMNFLQTFALMPTDNIPMPRFMYYYYKVVVLFIYFLHKWLYSACFSDNYTIVESRSHNALIIYLLSIIIMVIILIFYWIVRYKRLNKGNQRGIGKKIMMGLIFIAFYFQPSILMLAFRGFICVEVEGVFYAKFNMGVECWTPTYTYLTIFCNGFLILLLLFVFTFKPYFIYYQYSRRKIPKEQFKLMIKDHYFFLGYKKKYAFWELIIFVRKLILIAYVSLIDADGNSIAVAILILNISHLVQLYFKPYKFDRLNQYENNAYFVITLNYYFLLFFYIEETNSNMNVALLIISVLALVVFGLMTINTLFYKKFEEKFKVLWIIWDRVFKWRKKNAIRESKVVDLGIEQKRVKKI